jgi:ATP-dependent Clp protease ATP-binding subunit ClpA
MIFISVLADQLKKFSNCDYFKVEVIKYINDPQLRDIRMRIMNCLLLMTEEFTIRSVKAAKDSQNNAKIIFSKDEPNDISNRLDNDINNLSNIMSWSSSNHLLVMFHEDSQCITPIYREKTNLPKEVKELVESQKGKLEDYKMLYHHELLDKLLNIVGKQFMFDLLICNNDYVLTADNFLKMLLIIIRARTKVPIVIMGETGCGKTSLVRYLAKTIMCETF